MRRIAESMSFFYQENQKEGLALFKRLSEHKSWHVRYILTQSADILFEKDLNFALELMKKLANDQNWQVRNGTANLFHKAAVKKFEEIYPKLREWILNESILTKRAIMLGVSPRLHEKMENSESKFELIEPLLFESDEQISNNLSNYVLPRICLTNSKKFFDKITKWIKINDYNVKLNVLSSIKNFICEKYPQECINILFEVKDDSNAIIKEMAKEKISIINEKFESLVKLKKLPKLESEIKIKT